jgi:GntR family transcriptional repressor for pyruvate dehydrogenase complex
MIHDGTLKPGDQLPSERELMQRYGVGRPAVREALFALQKMGLVAVTAGDRARVTAPTPEIVIDALSGAARHMLAAPHGVRSFQDARLFFEVGLARHAAMHASEDDIAELNRALEANRLTIGDIPRFERTDVAFHYVLAVIPRNPIFTAIHAAIAEWLVEQRHITLTRPGQNEIAYRAHAAIARAIAARDPDRAERLMRAHLEQVVSVYWQAVEPHR